MANATRSTAWSTRNDSFQSAFVCSTAFAVSLIQAQCVQLEALISWQQSVAAINKELWDQWACRWAGR